MGQFKPGQSGNPAGRKSGSETKQRKQLRDMISNFLQDNWEQIENDFDSLQPKDRVNLFVKLVEFHLPKKRAIDSTDELRAHLERLTSEELADLIKEKMKIDVNDDN